MLAKVTDGDPLGPEFERSADVDGSPAGRNSALEEAIAAYIESGQAWLLEFQLEQTANEAVRKCGKC